MLQLVGRNLKGEKKGNEERPVAGLLRLTMGGPGRVEVGGQFNEEYLVLGEIA